MTPQAPRDFRSARAAAIAATAGLMVLALALANCTVTKENYKTLSFWFDGVPDPNAQLTVIDPQTGESRPAANLSVHKPYIEERCGECHKGRSSTSRTSSGICLQCHPQIQSEHRYMHGPVAAGACLWCHHPHESQQLHLLRGPDRTVCSQCHTPGLLSSKRVPEHADASRACLECHMGHGGPKPMMLRQDAPAPATPPASTEK